MKGLPRSRPFCFGSIILYYDFSVFTVNYGKGSVGVGDIVPFFLGSVIVHSSCSKRTVANELHAGGNVNGTVVIYYIRRKILCFDDNILAYFLKIFNM